MDGSRSTINDGRRSSMGTRRKSRELALQMLFQADMGRQNAADVRRTFWAERNGVTADVRSFAEDLFRVATDRAEEIDKLIERHTEHWRMERMAAVDRNIIRGAVAEFLAYPSTPKAVIINEALEIARKFSSPESVQFINGVLDSIAKELEKQASGSRL
jgi:transcription antitermination protein NusB